MEGVGSAVGIPVHPHASGEHSRIIRRRRRDYGSSPREWGTPGIPTHAPVLPRFIPTRVGNTLKLIMVLSRESVHPHASGEHLGKVRADHVKPGSSPREWGTHATPCGSNGRTRFIPTRVGNTPQPRSAVLPSPVHPHASGEHRLPVTPLFARNGSSPREWGTLCSSTGALVECRFIPTRVGNTSIRIQE